MGCPTLPSAQCDDPNSDWFVFTTTPALIANPLTYLSGQSPTVGPGHWELYEQDFDRIQSTLNNNAYRFSFEWSRIFPTSTAGVTGYDGLKAIANPEAVAHYHAMLDAMKARGITPLATLIHYTLPSWIHDAVGCNADLTTCSPRGWVDRVQTVAEAAKYAGFVAREFGGKIDWWATLNEPYQVLLFGYVYPNAERTNPPSVLLKFDEAKIVMTALIEAHARMYDAIKSNDTVDASGDGVSSQVGVVYPVTPVHPKDPNNPRDVAGAENMFYLWNGVYLNAVARGMFDANLDGNAVLREDLAGRMDYLGMNYYFKITVEGTDTPIFATLSPKSTFNPITAEISGEYAKGLYEMLLYLKQTYHLPIVITENGVDDKDGSKGPGFLVRHLSWLKRAMREGVDVRGYFYWSLMDNYEWNHGMNMHFGLFGVDPSDPDKTRTTKPSAETYGRISKLRELPLDLRQQFPIAE